MDRSLEVYPHFRLYVGSGGWVDLGETMKIFSDWLKKWLRRNKLKKLVNKVVQFGSFRGTNGGQLSYYVDCRPLIANSSIRLNIIKSFYDLIIDDRDLIFVGPQTSGAILATDMALFSNTDAVIVNITKNLVVYPFETDLRNKKIILIDDVLTTGGTIKKCIDLIGLPVYKIFVIVNRSDIEEIDGIQVLSLFRGKDLSCG
jgi:orotate phosphoribosyltransferase